LSYTRITLGVTLLLQ